MPRINKDTNKEKVKRPVDTFLRKDRNTTKRSVRGTTVSNKQTKKDKNSPLTIIIIIIIIIIIVNEALF